MSVSSTHGAGSRSVGEFPTKAFGTLLLSLDGFTPLRATPFDPASLEYASRTEFPETIISPEVNSTASIFALTLTLQLSSNINDCVLIPVLEDVTFSFVKDSDVLFNLPGMNESNIRESIEFEDVKAVDLGDYDGDGAKEIVTISEYRIGKEGQGRPDGLEARIYRFDSDGMPQLDRNLTAAVNKNVTVLSLSGIAHYIREGSDREAFGDRMEAYAAEVAEADPESYNKFALIYVNDDRFPELLELGTSDCKGAKIVFYNDGVLEESKVSSNFSYLNKANLLYSRSGTDNLFTEGIYVYAGNGFTVYQSGTYGTMDAAVTAYTKTRKPEYTYMWEGSIVSEAGYNDAIGFIYDAQKALDPSKITMLGAEDFLQELKNK